MFLMLLSGTNVGPQLSPKQLFGLLRACTCVPVPRSYLDYDGSLTDKETVMLVEEVVLLFAFAVTEIKRLIFVDSIFDSIKVWVWWWEGDQEKEMWTLTDSQSSEKRNVLTGQNYLLHQF